MIVLDQVSKYFGTKQAVKEVSLKIKKGEIVGLLGRNGAGKTTTMRLIVGFLEPSDGDVTVDDYNPLKNRVETLAQIGYLPENNPLYPDMKVAEYLQFVASVKEVSQRSVSLVCKQTGLVEVMEEKIEGLSRGFKQRVGLAAALLGDPSIVVLDEPTSGLDPLEQENIRGLIKILGQKKTIILSTHVLSEVEDVATRLIIINKGAIVFDGPKPKGKGAVEKVFRKLVS